MNKQIEEMAKILEPYIDNAWAKDCFPDCDSLADLLYNEGYRKQSEVAREIFDEIEQALLNLEYKATYRHTHVPLETMVEVCNWILHEAVPQRLAELKKKYEVTDE